MTIQDLEYIQQIERELKSYKAEICVVQRALESARQELETIKRERDVAVNELVGTCQVCRWEETAKCASCHFNVDAWNVSESNWEFRGVCQENTEAQNDG